MDIIEVRKLKKLYEENITKQLNDIQTVTGLSLDTVEFVKHDRTINSELTSAFYIRIKLEAL